MPRPIKSLNCYTHPETGAVLVQVGNPLTQSTTDMLCEVRARHVPPSEYTHEQWELHDKALEQCGISQDIIAVATINPVREAVMASLDPDNLAGVLIKGTATRVQAVGPLPTSGEDLGWLTRHLTECLVNGTLKPGRIVFNRYVAWSVWDELRLSNPKTPTLRSERDPASDAYTGD